MQFFCACLLMFSLSSEVMFPEIKHFFVWSHAWTFLIYRIGWTSILELLKVLIL